MRERELYFYTSTILQWKPLIKDFHLEPVIVDSLAWLNKKQCIDVFGFVIMPNHIHLIWELLKNNGKESPVASFMKYTAHHFLEIIKNEAPQILESFKVDWKSRKYNIWQTNVDRFKLYNPATIEQKLNYIHLNPTRGKWKLVKDPCDYFYSSCRFYKKGINDFEFLKDYRKYLR